MRKSLIGLSLVLGGLALAMPALAGGPEIKIRDVASGKVLTDGEGFTLYFTDEDKDGKSNCIDVCADNWPPFVAPEGAMPEGDYTILKRSDFYKTQWVRKGKPLYRWNLDEKPGMVTGDGFRNIWHAARP